MYKMTHWVKKIPTFVWQHLPFFKRLKKGVVIEIVINDVITAATLISLTIIPN